MQLGFSYVGLIYLVMLFVPNILWSKHVPQDYETYAKNENKILLAFERIGEVSVSALCLIFSDFNINELTLWALWLLASFLFMVLYETYWVTYFLSEKTMGDMYRSFLGIPVAGATLPVIAFLLLSIYGKNVFLFVAVVLLGIGHIGIHLGHKKELKENQK